ncbi:MAG: TolC family protein [Planctomycetota bacterium]
MSVPAERPPQEYGVRRLPVVTIAAPLGTEDRTSGRLETLSEAWATALAVNQALEARRWEVSSSQHSLLSAAAERWPTLSVEGSYTVRDNEPGFRFDFLGIPLSTNTFPYAQDESFAFRTKVALPLYTSGRIGHGIAAADARACSAERQLEESAMDLKRQVAEEYVSVLRAQREVELTDTTSRSLEAHLRDVKLLFEHDQVPVNDLLAAQVALSDARQSAIRAHNQLDAGRAAHNRRLGRPLQSPVRIAELAPEAVEEDLESLTRLALGQRAALARLKAEARALDYQARSLRARDRPQIDLRGEYVLEENQFRSPEGIAAVGVGISWNVLDAGRGRHEAAALLDRAEGMRRLHAELESLITLDVRRAWLYVEETRRRLEVTAGAIEQAEENLRVVKIRYGSGMGINTEVLDAETLRTQAYRNHHNATYDAVLAVIRLRHATAEL